MRLRHLFSRTLLLLLLLLAAGCVHRRPAQAPAATAARFRFVQITDTHYGPALHTARIRKAVDAINALPMPVAFVLHTGDVASGNLNAATAAAISNEFARLAVPCFFVPGNHDILPRRLDETLAAFTNYLGALTRRHEQDGVVFLMLYTEPLRTGIKVPGFDPLAWLAAELEATGDRPVVIAHHAPDGPDFYRNRAFPGWPAGERERWLATLRRGNVKALLAGHFHRAEMHWNELGIPTYVAAAVAGFWGRQASFRIYTYADGRLSYHTVYLEDARSPP